MNSEEYILATRKTESLDMDAIRFRVNNKETIRILHMALGLSTEAAEIQDALKKYLFYGRPFDKVNVLEEIGDILWYLARLLDILGHPSFSKVMDVNIAKLNLRYKDEKFLDTSANNRDLKLEREILDNLDDTCQVCRGYRIVETDDPQRPIMDCPSCTDKIRKDGEYCMACNGKGSKLTTCNACGGRG